MYKTHHSLIQCNNFSMVVSMDGLYWKGVMAGEVAGLEN